MVGEDRDGGWGVWWGRQAIERGGGSDRERAGEGGYFCGLTVAALSFPECCGRRARTRTGL